MYGLVLIAAAAPGGDIAPGGFGCGGCYGMPAGCLGSVGVRHAGFGLGGHRSSCLGCTGYSCSGYNCFGSCHGYRAVFPGCHGSGCYGCYGAGAAVMGPTVAMPPYDLLGPGVGYGCAGVYGSVTNPNPPVVVVPPEPKKEDPKKDKDGNDGMGANVRFRLPAAAKLFVDGRPTDLTGAERAFVTPPLAAGRYFYEVRAEVVVGGRRVVEEKRVVVEAGATVTETFGQLIAAAEGAAAVAGK